MLSLVLLSVLFGLSSAQYACLCGSFVQSMYPGLSNIEPCAYIGDGEGPSMNDDCDLPDCRDYCAAESAAYDWDLDRDVGGGLTAGQQACNAVDEILGEGSTVINEELFVRARLPDCDTYFLWDMTTVYESGVQLCCDGGSYVPC